MTIDVVDESDHPVGTIDRHAVLGSGQAFRTAHVFLRDSGGRLLLQRLATTRPRHPGRWGSSIAAYLHAGETYEAAASRRLGEELGVAGATLRLLGKLRMDEEGARKFVTLFAAEQSGPLTPDPAVIDEVRWAAAATIRDELAARPESFTPTFAVVFELYRREA